MTKKPSPVVPEFETLEQADSYARWFRAKVKVAMGSHEPRLPHDQVIAEIHARLEAKRKVRSAS